MFPTPPNPTCPWCGTTFDRLPTEDECPSCGQPCGERVYALDVYEGKSRPRVLFAVIGWSLTTIASAMLIVAVARGSIGDAIVSGVFVLLLLIIAGAETHGLMLLQKGIAPRRLILTSEGVEVIDPHRIRGITSLEWPEVDRIALEPATQGGTRIQVFRHGDAQRKAAIKVVTASRDVAPDDVQGQGDRLRTAAGMKSSAG